MLTPRARSKAVALIALSLSALACSDDGGFKVGALGALELRPGSLEYFVDSVEPGAAKVLYVEVANTGTGAVALDHLAVTAADAPSEGLPAAVTAAFEAALPLTVEAGTSAMLAVTYTRVDDLARELTLTLGVGGAQSKSALLPIHVRRGEARLAITPSTARFEAGSDATTMQLTVLNVGTRTLWLGRLELRGDDSFAATFADAHVSAAARTVELVPPVELAAGTSRPLTVDFTERSQTPVEGELVFYGDAPNTLGGYALPLLGNDTEPCIVARPPRVDFGEKSPGTINDLPVEIENCGQNPAAVDSITLSTASDAADPATSDLGVDAATSARFSLVFDDGAPDAASPWTLAPGEVRTFGLRYFGADDVAPGQVAPDAGFVILRSDAVVPLRVIPLAAATRGELEPTLCNLDVAPSVPVDETCTSSVRPGELEPAVRWAKTAFDAMPAYSNVMMTPVVGNLTDDNGDGRVDAGDVADIVITRFAGGSYGSPGVLTALSGDDGRELWSLPEAAGQAVAPFGIGGVALGDLDHDGRPEVCVQSATDSLVCWQVAAGNAPPTLRFEVPGCAAVPYPTLGVYPAIADLDGDGRAEVLYLGCVVDADGNVVARIPAGATPSILPFAADVDPDPGLEIVDGGVVYDTPRPGSTTLVQLYDLGLPGARAAVGDFDHDGRPEIVASHWHTRTLRLFDPDGAADPDGDDGWQVEIPQSTHADAGGPPTIADFDGDGELEIGIASELAYVAFDTDGSVLWTQPCTDASSRQTGSSVFDFDGDGAAEVLYADENDLRIFDGATGSVRFIVGDHGSGTGVEYPVIADVNHDGRAEIVLASNNYYSGPWNGVHVLGARDDTWSSAPPVWNQHAYTVDGIRSDLSVPPVPARRFGSFRAAEWGDGETRPDADLQLVAVDLCPVACDADGVVESARVHLQIGNGGLLPATGSVTLREGSATGPVIAMSAVPEVGSGAVFAFEMNVPRAIWADRTLVAVVSASAPAFDCRADNDVRTLGGWPWPEPVSCE